MGLDYKFRPLVTFPKPLTRARTEARFLSTSTGKRMPLSATMDNLERELRALGARNVSIQVALKDSDIRLDGMIRATARQPEHPGVILSFDSTAQGAMSFAQDKYTNWHDNLRSIALTLEALRKVDRYGVTEHGEQYQGFKALPAASGAVVTDPRRNAAETLIRHSGKVFDINLVLSNMTSAQCVYTEAVHRTHPDAGGKSEDFMAVREAWAILQKVSGS